MKIILQVIKSWISNRCWCWAVPLLASPQCRQWQSSDCHRWEVAVWWLMGVFSPKGHEAITWRMWGEGKKKKKPASIYNRAPHIIYLNIFLHRAHLNGLHWKFRLYGSERQRTSNDFASNMSMLVNLTAFGLLKQDKAWNNKQQFYLNMFGSSPALCLVMWTSHNWNHTL